MLGCALRQLPLARAVPAREARPSANKKGTPKGAVRDSNYTPRSPQALWRLARCAVLRVRATLAEQLCLPCSQASLQLGVAALSAPPLAMQAAAQLFEALRTKTKGTPKGAFCFGGEGETRTLAPGLIRPTPLAGAPRHQLEYFSIHQAQACRLQNLHMILYRIKWDLSSPFCKIDQ